NEKAQPPPIADQPSGQKQDYDATDTVRGIPDRHFRGKLPWRKPMRQQARARWKSHPLDPAIEHPEQSERKGRGTRSTPNVQERGPGQTDHHKSAGIATVRKEAVGKLGNAVKHPVGSQEKAQVVLGYAEIVFHHWHSDSKIFSNEVEDSVTDNRGEK